MDTATWPSEWLRGILGLSVLSIVADGETYGYSVAQRLADAGLGTVKGGTLYPILTRLEQDELLTSSWRDGDGGPGRKYYVITDRGAAHLAERAAAWREFAGNATAVIEGNRRTS